MRKVFFVLVPGLMFLGACGNDPLYVDNPGPEKITTTENVHQYLVQADGVVYRCFQTVDSRGGIWCTVKAGN